MTTQVGEVVGEGEAIILLIGISTNITSMEINREFPQKSKQRITR